MVFYWNTAMSIIWVLSKGPHCSRGTGGYRPRAPAGPWGIWVFLVCDVTIVTVPPRLALVSTHWPIFPSGCEGKLGVALESLQGLRDLT